MFGFLSPDRHAPGFDELLDLGELNARGLRPEVHHFADEGFES